MKENVSNGYCNFRAMVIQLHFFHCFKKFNCMTHLKSWSMLESLRVHSQIKEPTYWMDITYCVLKLCHTHTHNNLDFYFYFLFFPLFAISIIKKWWKFMNFFISFCIIKSNVDIIFSVFCHFKKKFKIWTYFCYSNILLE